MSLLKHGISVVSVKSYQQLLRLKNDKNIDKQHLTCFLWSNLINLRNVEFCLCRFMCP